MSRCSSDAIELVLPLLLVPLVLTGCYASHPLPSEAGPTEDHATFSFCIGDDAPVLAVHGTGCESITLPSGSPTIPWPGDEEPAVPGRVVRIETDRGRAWNVRTLTLERCPAEPCALRFLRIDPARGCEPAGGWTDFSAEPAGEIGSTAGDRIWEVALFVVPQTATIQMTLCVE
jgi:hypothetical protein